MDTRSQTLPPGWRLQALGPFPDTRKCVLRLTNPEGEEVAWLVDEHMAQCGVVKQLAQALALTGETFVEDVDELSGPL